MAKIGRKALWDELNMSERLDMVKGWALQGSTDKDMMEMLGISHETFYRWKKEKSEFSDAIKKGKYDSNGELLNSAFRQANGYYQTVTEPMKLKDVDGSERIEMVTYDKFIPANNTMSIFMLKNRIPEQYKDKQHLEQSGTVTNKIDLSTLSDEEIENELKKLKEHE